MSDVALYQRTLAQPVLVDGLGFFGGAPERALLSPAPTGSGIVFRSGDAVASCRYDTVVPGLDRTVRLQVGGNVIHAVEHLLSAIVGEFVDNIAITVEGLELPTGRECSSALFADAIRRAGVVSQDEPPASVKIPEQFRLALGSSTAKAGPRNRECVDLGVLLLEVLIDFPLPVGRQTFRFEHHDPMAYVREISWARSFLRTPVDYVWPNGMTTWERVCQYMLSLPRDPDRCSVLTYDLSGKWRTSPRYADEPVRHKVLDLLGDLALCGMRIVGALRIERPGHEFNLSLARVLSGVDQVALSQC